MVDAIDKATICGVGTYACSSLNVASLKQCECKPLSRWCHLEISQAVVGEIEDGQAWD